MLKYHNIEGLQLPKSEDLFFQPSSWNEYTGFNKYPVYAWFSFLNGLTWSTQRLDDYEIDIKDNSQWISIAINDELKNYLNVEIYKFSMKDENVDYVLINNEKYGDLEFLIRFEWDEGDRSVGIWPGYNVSLVLNNEKPVYRTFDYAEEENP